MRLRISHNMLHITDQITSTVTAASARAKKAQVAQEVQREVKVIRQKKKVEKKKAVQKEKNKPKPVYKIGDRVRLQDGKAVGTIDKLEKNKAVVNYGMFTTNVSVDQLELVERTKS